MFPFLEKLAYERIKSVPPIIVVGMHRSGTTLLVRLLESCGVFMGIRQTRNSESIFFQNLNKEALDMLGCSWRCLDFLPETSKLSSHYQWLREMIAKKLKNDLIAEYFGRNVLCCLTKSGTLWGWKDPRNSLLLPLWKQIFPEATVIHIFRDGRDVALSLLNREIKWEGGKSIFSEEEMSQRFIADVKLWETYIRRIQETLPLFKKNYTLKYEQLLSTPLQEMERLVQAMNIPVRSSSQKVISIIDSSRTKQHEKHEFSWARGLVDNSEVLEKLGYLL